MDLKVASVGWAGLLMCFFPLPSQVGLETIEVGVAGDHVAKALDVSAGRTLRSVAVGRGRRLDVEPELTQTQAARFYSPFSSARVSHCPVASAET